VSRQKSVVNSAEARIFRREVLLGMRISKEHPMTALDFYR